MNSRPGPKTQILNPWARRRRPEEQTSGGDFERPFDGAPGLARGRFGIGRQDEDRRKGEPREAYYSNIALANPHIEQGSIDRALETLWKCPEHYRHWEWGHLRHLCHQDAASFRARETKVTATFFGPDGEWVVSQDAAGLAKVWDWEAEEQVFAFGSIQNVQTPEQDPILRYAMASRRTVPPRPGRPISDPRHRQVSDPPHSRLASSLPFRSQCRSILPL